MTILINHREVVTEVATVLALTEELKLPHGGVAIAVGNHVIPRADWGTTTLNAGDEVTIIKAAFGG